MINQGRTSFLSAPALEGMLEGGVPIMVDGHCVGAVGVSGVKSAEDAQIARAGIAALRRLAADGAAGPRGRASPLQSAGLPANTAALAKLRHRFPLGSTSRATVEGVALSARTGAFALLPVLPPALLALADGTTFLGTSIGAAGHTVGEVVFNTALTGYQEILTDPSYCRQIVTLTYPHIGNYGVNAEDVEAGRGPCRRPGHQGPAAARVQLPRHA